MEEVYVILFMRNVFYKLRLMQKILKQAEFFISYATVDTLHYLSFAKH